MFTTHPLVNKCFLTLYSVKIVLKYLTINTIREIDEKGKTMQVICFIKVNRFVCYFASTEVS